MQLNHQACCSGVKALRWYVEHSLGSYFQHTGTFIIYPGEISTAPILCKYCTTGCSSPFSFLAHHMGEPPRPEFVLSFCKKKYIYNAMVKYFSFSVYKRSVEYHKVERRKSIYLI